MNSDKFFTFEDTEVKFMFDDDGNPWVFGGFICKELGLKNPSDAMSRLSEADKMNIAINDIHRRGDNKKRVVVNEFGFYDLVFQSNKPKAQRMKKWLTHVVMPSIRKTGSYGIPTGDQLPTDPVDQAMMLAEKLVANKHKLLELEEKVKEDEHKVVFADTVSKTENDISMCELAHRLNIPNFGEKKLFAWMREKDYCCIKKSLWNQPTQMAINSGVLKSVTESWTRKATGKEYTTTRSIVTPKGIVYFPDRVKRDLGIIGDDDDDEDKTQLVLVG